VKMNSVVALRAMQFNLNAVADRVADVAAGSEANSVADAEMPSVSEELDETSVLRFAQWHNLLPWLSLYVDRFELGSSEFRQKLAKLSRLDGAVDSLRIREAIRLSSALYDNQIPHVFFKGVTVTEQFYRGLVTSRYADDIDLLLRSEDLPRAYQLISSLGYQQPGDSEDDPAKLTRFVQRYPWLYRWRDMSLCKNQAPKQHLDLHWRIADWFTFPIETEQLIEQRSSICVQGENLPALPFAMLFVYVCVHGHTDYFFRLRYLVDVYAAMQQSEFNQAEVLGVAKSLGVKQKVIDSIATAKLFFDGEEGDNEYASLVLKRFFDSNGFPERGHPNRRRWTSQQRRRYITKQVRHRSNNNAWYEPLLARCKYNQSMVASWPERIHPLVWHPVAMIKKSLK
jgi:hypothetical protein